jgi:hypothetical protein
MLHNEKIKDWFSFPWAYSIQSVQTYCYIAYNTVLGNGPLENSRYGIQVLDLEANFQNSLGLTSTSVLRFVPGFVQGFQAWMSRNAILHFQYHTADIPPVKHLILENSFAVTNLAVQITPQPARHSSHS